MTNIRLTIILIIWLKLVSKFASKCLSSPSLGPKIIHFFIFTVLYRMNFHILIMFIFLSTFIYATLFCHVIRNMNENCVQNVFLWWKNYCHHYFFSFFFFLSLILLMELALYLWANGRYTDGIPTLPRQSLSSQGHQHDGDDKSSFLKAPCKLWHRAALEHWVILHTGNHYNYICTYA